MVKIFNLKVKKDAHIVHFFIGYKSDGITS